VFNSRYRYFAADKVSFKVQPIQSDNDSTAVTIVVLPQTHVFLT